MSIETRSSTALFVRAEQLKRWEESDTNREPGIPKQKPRKVNFSSGCVFLAACAAGEKDEVFRLIGEGADIDTANVDGLTALHQACIDDNLEMVEFLVENGADVNRGDNEGWTPLHATASCGFLSIAKYLIEHGADVAAVNNDGQLALDITDYNIMEDFLRAEIKQRGVDIDEARNEEERLMLRDAKEWLATKSPAVDKPHPKTGATPLHVAAAKGYTEVMKILLQCGADVDKQDVDGWTPLHAAAHWDQEETLKILMENLADMDAKNYAGQTAFDLASTPEMCAFLEDLKKKQNKEEVLNRRQAKKRNEILDRQTDAETPMKVKKVEVEIGRKDENIEKRNRVNSLPVNEPVTVTIRDAETIKGPPSNPPKQLLDVNSDDNNTHSWRKLNLKPTIADAPLKNSAQNRDKKNEEDVTIRRTNSFKNDPDNSTKEDAPPVTSNNTTATSTATTTVNSPNKLTTTTVVSPATSPSPNSQPSRVSGLKVAFSPPLVAPVTTSATTPSTPTSPGGTRLAIFKNFFKSFVPPSRDEESETQRKAHAKRVRETRRSTQCVTIEEIKSAEQIVRNKTGANNGNEQQLGANGDSTNVVSVTATITTATPTVVTRETEEPAVTHERRPSWRLKIDAGSKFKLEEVSKSSDPPSTPSFVRRTGVQTNVTTATTRPSSTPIETADTTTVTLPLRRPKSQDDKEQDKENDARNAQATLATQAAIQRRKRPKRRSTGLVNFDNVDDLDPDKDPAGGGDCEDVSKLNHQDSGNERSSRSRLGSASDIPHRTENGEIDYKKLYEQTLVENDRLKDKLRKSEEELRDTKQTLERINVVTSKNSLSELEKRERRAMERKLSEMEEELKQLENLKTENQRLKDENGALIRVISKLSK